LRRILSQRRRKHRDYRKSCDSVRENQGEFCHRRSENNGVSVVLVTVTVTGESRKNLRKYPSKDLRKKPKRISQRIPKDSPGVKYPLESVKIGKDY